MVPTGDQNNVSQTDPPMTVAGMNMVVLDPEGRLVSLAVVPPQLDSAPAPARRRRRDRLEAVLRRRGSRPGRVRAGRAGVDAGALCRQPAAWIGPQPAIPGLKLRVEAGGYRGKPVYFLRVAAWTHASRDPTTITARSRVSWSQAIATLAVFAIFVRGGARRPSQPAQRTRRSARRVPAGGVRVDRGVCRRAPQFEARRGPGHRDGPLVHDPAAVGRGPPVAALSRARALRPALLARHRRRLVAADGAAVARSRRRTGDPARHRARRPRPRSSPSPAACSRRSSDTRRRRGRRRSTTCSARAYVLAQVGNQVFNAILNALFVVFGMVLLKIVVRREWAAVDGGDRALQLHQRARPRPRSGLGDQPGVGGADPRDHRAHRPVSRPARDGDPVPRGLHRLERRLHARHVEVVLRRSRCSSC